MTRRVGQFICLITLGLGIVVFSNHADAAPKPEPVTLTPEGEKQRAEFAALLNGLQAAIIQALPSISEQKKTALAHSRETLKTAEVNANQAKKIQEKVKTAKALVDHAKGKWIGGAEKGIALATTAMKKAANDAELEAAKKDLAKWQANKEDGIKALQERQKALDQAIMEEAIASVSTKLAQTAFVQAQADERIACNEILAEIQATVASETRDAQLCRAVIIAKATPARLAEFAQRGKTQTALVRQLLADDSLMKQMLIAGGAMGGNYGNAMEIYNAIQLASPKSRDGLFQRLALAVSLEFAEPIKQTNAQAATNAPAFVDPVKRYLHYEKAYLDGELDAAFKNFSVWEYRMIVDSDAPDEILKWGREMLRNYRPDHVDNPDYGWRYSGAVRTEVKYGSECVKDDLPTLNTYQNIPKDGGVCGRRAFFGRFILKSFGIPTWGVTQHKHAAVGHWTPKGWVINLGAGFQHSWWDKDENPRSGSDFLLETQARKQPQDYMKVLRAQWISAALGEQEFNDRKHIIGGLWSNMAHQLARTIATNTKAVELKPLGQELAETNESDAKKALAIQKVNVLAADKKIVIDGDGRITIPAVAYHTQTGHVTMMKSHSAGFQIHATGGYKAQYQLEAPQTGNYMLTVRVSTIHEGQKFLVTNKDTQPAVEVAVPYTLGMWQMTKPLEIELTKGKNNINFTIQDGSRGVAIKDFTLTPIK